MPTRVRKPTAAEMASAPDLDEPTFVDEAGDASDYVVVEIPGKGELRMPRIDGKPIRIVRQFARAQKDNDFDAILSILEGFMDPEDIELLNDLTIDEFLAVMQTSQSAEGVAPGESSRSVSSSRSIETRSRRIS